MSRVGSLLVSVFVGEEFDVFVFVGFGILYPISLGLLGRCSSGARLIYGLVGSLEVSGLDCVVCSVLISEIER